MSKPETPSAFVQRCQEALLEYQRLRFLGAGHETAARALREAITPNRKPDAVDVKQLQAGK